MTSAALPAILNHGEAASKIKYLTAENEKYRNMVSNIYPQVNVVYNSVSAWLNVLY